MSKNRTTPHLGECLSQARRATRLGVASVLALGLSGAVICGPVPAVAEEAAEQPPVIVEAPASDEALPVEEGSAAAEEQGGLAGGDVPAGEGTEVPAGPETPAGEDAGAPADGAAGEGGPADGTEGVTDVPAADDAPAEGDSLEEVSADQAPMTEGTEAAETDQAFDAPAADEPASPQQDATLGDPPLTEVNAAADISASLEDFLTPQQIAEAQAALEQRAWGISAFSTQVSFADLLVYAAQYLGMPYVWGGADPAQGGFDCSGFVSWVYSNVAGVSIRSTAESMYYSYCTPISKEEAQPGDLVFFMGTYGSPDEITHVGIYLGDGKMIHAGTSGISYAKVDWLSLADGSGPAPQLYARVDGVDIQDTDYHRFYDVPSAEWYVTEGYLDFVVDNGIMQGSTSADGTSDGMFHPSDMVTRGQIATILYRVANPYSTDTTNPEHYALENGFLDSPVDPVSGEPVGWYYNAAIKWCHENGIITGYKSGPDAGCFLPDNPVTREDLATMVWRFANVMGVDVSGADPSAFYATTDFDTVQDHAVDALIWCADQGIVNGHSHEDGTLTIEPQQGAKRCEVAKVVTVLVRDVIWWQ